MNNIIVIILFILVIILFINDITQLFSLKEGAVDLPLVINEAQDPNTTSTANKCPEMWNSWKMANVDGDKGELIDWSQVEIGDIGDRITKSSCNDCALTEWITSDQKCRKTAHDPGNKLIKLKNV
jgi:hypothetical protein